MKSKNCEATAKFWEPQYGSRPCALVRVIDLYVRPPPAALLHFRAQEAASLDWSNTVGFLLAVAVAGSGVGKHSTY